MEDKDTFVKEYTDSIKFNFQQRLTNPFLGTFTVSWLLIHWQLLISLFYLNTKNDLATNICLLQNLMIQYTLWDNLFIPIGLGLFMPLVINFSKWVNKILNDFTLNNVFPRIFKNFGSNLTISRESYDLLDNSFNLLKNELNENNKKINKLMNENSLQNENIKVLNAKNKESEIQSSIVLGHYNNSKNINLSSKNIISNKRYDSKNVKLEENFKSIEFELKVINKSFNINLLFVNQSFHLIKNEDLNLNDGMCIIFKFDFETKKINLALQNINSKHVNGFIVNILLEENTEFKFKITILRRKMLIEIDGKLIYDSNLQDDEILIDNKYFDECFFILTSHKEPIELQIKNIIQEISK